ncbi:MAG: Asp-tRNA(Asn)/Glu-tRNA(Gln) amidotransferase subunit GatC [Candidatus Atribacteria bacterium]|nr:Asp-tRNA(Asn)/Glu-tRNA(Gln) amidotransferase subunit GatC [Candidatus Atribacteria bacterium]
MKIDLERIEALAAIKLEENERESIKNDLSNIIAYFENLKEVDTSSVEPLIYMDEARLNLREDMVKDGLKKADIEKLRELFGDGFFKVKKIIGE